MTTTLAVIGGTGVYALEGFEHVREVNVATPFGRPSSRIVEAELHGVRLLFLARHGQGHTLLPSEVNYRANIFALKKLGAEWCLGISAVGSLRDEIAPGQVVIPDQIIDRTWRRESSFFGGGVVAHVSFGEPFCPVLRRLVSESAAELGGVRVSCAGTYVCIEGPAFSSRAESALYRSWGADLVGMTVLPEAKLAREAELAYATLALVTDYDCWKEQEVNASEILGVLRENVQHAREVIVRVASRVQGARPSKLAAQALENALLTTEVGPTALKRLEPIIERYYRR